MLPPDTLRTLYFALIHPHLPYGNMVWGNAEQNVIRLVTLVQQRAIRVRNNELYYSPIFKKLGTLKLHDLFDYNSLLFVHDYLSNILPSSLNGCFPTNSDRPNSRAIRQSKLCYFPYYQLISLSVNLLVSCPHCGISGIN